MRRVSVARAEALWHESGYSEEQQQRRAGGSPSGSRRAPYCEPRRAASGRAQLHCGIASGDSDKSPGHWQQGTSDHHRRLARAPTELGAAVAFAPRVRSEPAFRVSSTSPSIFTSLVTEEMPVLSTECCQDPKRERPSGSGVASEGVGLGSEAKRERVRLPELSEGAARPRERASDTAQTLGSLTISLTMESMSPWSNPSWSKPMCGQTRRPSATEPPGDRMRAARPVKQGLTTHRLPTCGQTVTSGQTRAIHGGGAPQSPTRRPGRRRLALSGPAARGRPRPPLTLPR